MHLVYNSIGSFAVHIHRFNVELLTLNSHNSVRLFLLISTFRADGGEAPLQGHSSGTLLTFTGSRMRLSIEQQWN